MSDRPSNPASPLPIDEGDLLALIEGLSIPAERAARVREALGADPRLAELAALMRADREVVASLPEGSAPSDLLDRVEAQLERDALVGLARSEAAAVSDELPVSVIVPARKVWMTRRIGAPLAAAAAVALISGGVLMMIPPGKKPVVQPVQPGVTNLANNDSPDQPKGASDLAHGGTSTPPPVPAHPTVEPVGPSTDLVANPPTDTVPSLPSLPDKPVIAKAALSTEALLLAASEGRLVLRVRGDDTAAKARVDAVNANARSMRLDALDAAKSSAVASAYAGAFNPRPTTVTPVKPVVIPEAAPVAGTTNPKPAPTQSPTVPAEQPIEVPTAAPVLSTKAYVAYVPVAAETLESLRKAMGSDAEWQVVARAISFEPPTDAASVLWWTTPPASWTNRCTVPVVVQHN